MFSSGEISTMLTAVGVLTLLPAFQPLVQALAHGTQAKLLGVNVFGLEPKAFGRIIHGLQLFLVFHFAGKKQIESLHIQS